MDYEKGTPAWDIGMILTLHASEAHRDAGNCARVASLLDTRGESGRVRLDTALAVACTCGKGDFSAERTTYKRESDERIAREAAGRRGQEG